MKVGVDGVGGPLETIGETELAFILRPRAFFRQNGKLIIAAVVLSIFPDLDFLFDWLFGLGEGWHRGFTHSVALAIAVGFLVSFWFRDGQIKNALVLAATITSHSLLEIFTSKTPFGVELF